MYRHKCRDCGGLSYSSSSCKADEPCQYCGEKAVELDGTDTPTPSAATLVMLAADSLHKEENPMNNSIDTRTAALLLVDSERNRQDAKWGEQNHAPERWVGILGKEYGEYCQAVNETVFDNGPEERRKGGVDNMIKELSHVAAVAVGAIECLMRAETRKGDGK